ncbi:zinc finger protein 576, tandem duplicate 1 isoform X2 [Paramormyrops kingsleyae]|nr:uncharacterized protein LOC111854836 isoform X2 [Paramormyrops kingsleyae]
MQKQAVSGHIAPLARKDIPQKKDRMDPLKIDMSKTIVAPPTSAQLSLQCIECHIIFSDMKSKERHLKHSHPAEYEQCMLGDALFACYVCDRHFTCSSELMAHQRTHTEKHPFKCPICGDSFGRSSELTLHKKIHFGTHGYTCSECGKPCKTLTLLKYHQRTHTGERPYVCKDCGKRFSMSKTLQKHRVIHSQGEMEGVNDGTILSNPATSKACIRRISVPAAMAQSKPFACSLCNATFKSAKTRLQHMKHKHPHSGERMHNSTIPDGEPLKEGSLTESQIKTCETTEALENMVMFEQGQTLQVMETLGQEQMQQLAAFIETLGHDESVRQVQIVVPEQLQGEPEQSQEQNCSAGPELAQQQMVTVDSGQLEHLKETELEQLQGSAKETELEQAELQMETLEIQFTQAHVETMIEAPVEGHKEGLQLEQIKLMESKQVDVQANQMEETQRQEQNERLEQEVMGELELRHTVQCDESHGEMDLAIVGPDQGQVREQAGTQQKKSNQQAEAQQQKEDELPSQSSDEVQKLSEKTQFIQEETSAKIGQQNQKSKCLSKVIKETEQNKCDNSEEYPVILLCNENIHSSPFPTVNHDVPLEEQVVESVNEEQEAQLKNPLLISQPVNHSQSLQPETAKPKRTLQEKELTHHVEKQSKEKYIKRSKRGHLVVRFVAPERGRKSKPKPLELSKRQQKDDKEEVVPVAVKKIQLKGKRGKEKIIKKRESNKKHSQPLLQEIDLQVQNGVVKTSEQVRQVQSRRELRQSQKTVAKKELRQIQKDVGEKGTKRKRRQEQFEETHKKRREEISHMQLKYQEQMGAGKKLKIPQKKKEQKGKSGSSQNQEQLKKSLLLLKGHKQPQLKVHKLDPQKSPTGALKPPCQSQTTSTRQNHLKRSTKTEPQQRTKKIMPQRKQQRQTTKPKQDQQEDMLVTPLPDQSLSSSSSLKKSRAPRKRKPSALGIPQGAFRSQPQLALRCEYCGETFSEVVALEEHMAALCSSVTGPCQGNATISSLSDIPQAGEERSVTLISKKISRRTSGAGQDVTAMNGNEMRMKTLSNHRGDGVKLVGIAPSGADLCLTLDLVENLKSDKEVLGVHSNNYGIQTSTDWDMEVEMGEIGLGERVSFPALNPSPSLPHAPTCLEGEVQRGGEENGQLNVDSNIVTEAEVSLSLGASENGHSHELMQQGEETVKNQNDFKDSVDQSRQVRELNRIQQMEHQLQTGDVQLPIPHSHIIPPHLSNASQVKIQVTHDQHTVTTDKAQMEGEEQKPEFQKSNKEASDCIYLVDSGTVCQRVEEIKEELLLEVDMVTVGDESMENHLDTQDDNSLELVSSSQTTKVSTKSTSPRQATDDSRLPEHATNINAAAITSNTSTVSCAPDCSEVKQEEEEIEVQRKENCGKRINSERRKLTVTQKCGQRSKVQDDSTKETETEMGKDGCQVILEVHSITDGCHIKEEDQVEFLNQSHKLCADQKQMGPMCDGVGRASTLESHLPASLEESSDEQLVFELDSVTTSVEVLKAEHSLEEEPEKGPSSCQSPCVLLERIFRGRERDGEDLEHCQVEIRNGKRMMDSTMGFEVEGNQDIDTSGIILMESLRGQVIKVEEYSTESCTTASVRRKKPVVDQLNPCEKQRGVRMFLVKEEDSLVANEHQGFPQHGHTELMMGDVQHASRECLGTDTMPQGIRDQTVDIEQEGVSSVSPLILNDGDGGEQCIFLQVKEEEREVELAPSQREHEISVLVVSGTTALDDQMETREIEAEDQLVSGLHSGPFSSSGGFWVSVPPACVTEQGLAGTENCEVDSQQIKQTKTQPTVYVSNEQELKNAQEITDFLLQNSDAEDSDPSISDSELEEEAFVMACYHENQKCVLNSDKSPSKWHDHKTHSFSAQTEDTEESVGNEQERREQTPIDYFRQYLDWDTWEEIVTCNTGWPDFPTTVTAKEVAQFVGIHIAMGTLKFPDMRLYWQDLTRVPLVADSMPASRFFQLACKLRLGHRTRDSDTPTDADLVGTRGNRARSDENRDIHVERLACTSALAFHAGVPEIVCNLSNSNTLTHTLTSTGRPDHSENSEKPRSGKALESPSLHHPGTMKIHIHGTHDYAHNIPRETGLSDIALQHQSETGSSSSHHGTTHKTNTTENIPEIKKCNGSTDPLWRVRVLLERVRAGCLALNREGNYGIDEYPIHLGRSIRRKSFSNCPPTLNCAVLVGAGGFILDFNLNVDDSRKEDMVEKMVPRNKENREGAVFLCKEELATPVVVEHLLSAGVRSAARVGEVSGGMGNEFVSSDGKLTLFRCAQGFVLSTLRKRPSSKLSIVEEFERAQKVVQLNRELLGLYRTPLSASSPTCWPQSVLWHLTDMALVNSWLQYRVDHQQLKEPMKLMTFRLEVAKALILSNASDSPSSTPPPPPAPLPNQDSILSPSPTPYPTAHTPDDIFRYDGLGHWPEQVSQGEGGKCRFGGCDRTSQVRCLKCCVFLCISQNNNCFLKFHSKEKE